MSRPAPDLRHALALLAREASRARSGKGRLVLLRGATGTGRTTVLEAAAHAAAEQGTRVLRARCSPADATVPFAAVLQLLDPLPHDIDVTVDGDERATAARLWRKLRTCAGKRPLLIAVDDAHLADPASHRWLVESARQLDRLPVLLVVTERSQYDVDPATRGLAHTLAPALVRTHTLVPLAPAAAARWVLDAFPGAADAWVEDCVRAGAGSPLLLRALLDDLAKGDHSAVPDTSAALYPGTYPEAVAWWLESAGPATTEVARALAVLEEGWARERSRPRDGGLAGDGCTARARTLMDRPAREARAARAAHSLDRAEELAGLLADLSGTDLARVAGWLTAATGLGLLRTSPTGRPRYAHPLLRDAVLTCVPAARRRAAHRGAAEAMLRRGAATDAVARQLLSADPVGAPWAPLLLQDAATAALHEGRAGDTVAFLRRALDEPLSEGLRQRLLTELGSLEYAGRHDSAGIPRLTEALRLRGAPQDRVRAALALSTALTGRGRTRTAVELLRAVGGELGDRPDLVPALWTASALLADHDGEVRQEVYQRLSHTARHSPERVGAAGRALLVRHAAAAGLLSAREATDRVRALLAGPADPLTYPFLVGTAAALAQWADELDEAERLAERALAHQRPGLLDPMRQMLLDIRAGTAAARADYASLLAAPVPPVGGGGPRDARAHVLIALVETGRGPEAAALAAGFDLREAPDSWEVHRFLYARGAQRLAAGDPAGALHDFLECGRRQSAHEVVGPLVTPWRSAAAECRLALGLPREALALAERELELARVWGTPRTVGRALGVLAAATGGRRGLELAEDAVRLLRTAPTGTELVSALISLSRQSAAAGNAAHARKGLREAAERAEGLGALRLLALAEAALRKSGGRRAAARTGRDALTGSEHRIARLAAEGRTNAEISALLHLARRTVETHLTHSYRKLGIRRRAELKAALGEEG
ncbi:AAA family ATPase [Streptomyces sp. NPDC051567]|uniref:helix-turn-helix transcriptional regulator n=1 Tax=Streptomyces sp. NPDC051567 TaxID=3365660 RepID=UPI003787597B